MRMILSVFGFVAVMFSVVGAQANVSGRWQGKGEWTYEGKGTDCPVMLMAYEESANGFKRLKGFFECGVVALHSDPFSWERQGNELLFDGKKAGEINETGFVATEPYGDDVKITTKMTVTAETADYLEIWYGKDGKEIYVIRGTFKKL